MSEHSETHFAQPDSNWSPFSAPMGYMEASRGTSRPAFSDEALESYSRPEMYAPAEPAEPLASEVKNSAAVEEAMVPAPALTSRMEESHLPQTISDNLGIDPEVIRGPSGAPQIHVFGTPERVNAFVDRLTNHAIAKIAGSKPEAEKKPGAVNVLVLNNGIVANEESVVPGEQQASEIRAGDVMDYVDQLPDPSNRASVLSAWEEPQDKLGADVFWREISKRCTIGGEAPSLKVISEAALAVKGLVQFRDTSLPQPVEERLLGGLREDETKFPDALAEHANQSTHVLSNIVANQKLAVPEVIEPVPGGAATIGVINIKRNPNIDYASQLQAFNKLAARFTQAKPDIVVIQEGNAVDPHLAESFRRQGAVTIVTHTKDDNFIEKVAGDVNNDAASNNTCLIVAGPLGVSMAEQVSDAIGKEFNAYTSGRTRSASASVTLGQERVTSTLGSDSNRTESIESRPSVPAWELTGNSGILMAREGNIAKLDGNGRPLEYDPYLTKSQVQESPALAKRAARVGPKIPTLEQFHYRLTGKMPLSFTTDKFYNVCVQVWEGYCKQTLDNNAAPRVFEDWLSKVEESGGVNLHHADYVRRRWRKRNGY